MLGLATVLTDQGMEGVVAFVPPAPLRPKASQAEEVAHEDDEASEISMGTWILVGVILTAMLASGAGYWLAVQSSESDRQAAPRVITKPIQDLSGAAPVPESTASEPASGAEAQDSEASPARTAASRVFQPRTSARATPRSPSRPASESVFMANPAWTSQVRRIGDVDAETERSTMVILDSIHTVQERERQNRASAAKGSEQ